MEATDDVVLATARTDDGACNIRAIRATRPARGA
jgi:hypothetical protein